MKAGELLKQIERYLQYKEKLDKKHMPDDDAKIRISCNFNKLKVFYTLTSITPIHFNHCNSILELSNHNDNEISLNNMCNELRENSDMDIAFIIYDDEGNHITGIGGNGKFDINIRNGISITLCVEVVLV